MILADFCSLRMAIFSVRLARWDGGVQRGEAGGAGEPLERRRVPWLPAQLHDCHAAGDHAATMTLSLTAKPGGRPVPSAACNPLQRRGLPVIVGVHRGQFLGGLGDQARLARLWFWHSSLHAFDRLGVNPQPGLGVYLRMRQDRDLPTAAPLTQGESKRGSYATATGLVVGLLALWTVLIHFLA